MKFSTLFKLVLGILCLKVSKFQNEFVVIVSSNIWTINCRISALQYKGQKFWQFFVHTWGEMMTSYIQSEIYWPLKYNRGKFLWTFLGFIFGRWIIDTTKIRYIFKLTDLYERFTTLLNWCGKNASCMKKCGKVPTVSVTPSLVKHWRTSSLIILLTNSPWIGLRPSAFSTRYVY